MSKPIIASLGLFKETGGPVRTISQFKRALNAELYTFVMNRHAKWRDPANIGERIVISSRLPVLNELNFTPADRLSEIASDIRDASIVSIHSFYRFHAPQVAELAKRSGVPYWHVPHGILDPYVFKRKSMQRKVFLNLVGRRFLENSACTVFSTSRERDKAESIFGHLRGEIVYWPVERVKQSLQARDRAVLRAAWSIPENARVLLYFGRIHPMKRPLETIRAVAGVGHPNLYLVVMGPEDGVTAADCEAEAKRNDFANLRVVPPVYGNQKVSLIQACDAYISLSHRENFNHCAAESIAAGLPVLLSEGNDLLHDIKDTGFAWSVNDPLTIQAKQAIENFLSSSVDELSAMGQLGQEWVENNLAFEIFQRRLKGLERKYGQKS